MVATITSKGQVTIPKAVRNYLGVGPGSQVMFRLDDVGNVVVTRADGIKAVSRFDKLIGTADAGLSTDEIMDMTRGAGRNDPD